MAEAFAPFPLQRTIGNLTFYMMEGRNFVRKKSSLTRRKVLYSSQFANTRHFAALMAKASKIGSFVYNELPAYWRQGWMYRSFTGEAYKMLKAGKTDDEIQQVLVQRYVEPVVNKQQEGEVIVPSFEPPKRTYRKLNKDYWSHKTLKSIRRKANRKRVLHNAGLLGRAAKIGSILYKHLPVRHKCREYYQQLTGWVMKFLKDEWDEEDIIAELLPALSNDQSEVCKPEAIQKINREGIMHPGGRYYFIIQRFWRAPEKRDLQSPEFCFPQIINTV